MDIVHTFFETTKNLKRVKKKYGIPRKSVYWVNLANICVCTSYQKPLSSIKEALPTTIVK